MAGTSLCACGWLFVDCMLVQDSITELENHGSHIDMRTHAGSAFDSRGTLTFDLRVNASRAETLQSTIRVPGLELIAQSGFLLECGQIYTPISH